MYWMTRCVTSAVEPDVAANLLHSSAPMWPVCSTTASTAGLRSILALVVNSTSLSLRRVQIARALCPSAGVKSLHNNKQLLLVVMVASAAMATWPTYCTITRVNKSPRQPINFAPSAESNNNNNKHTTATQNHCDQMSSLTITQPINTGRSDQKQFYWLLWTICPWSPDLVFFFAVC